MRVGVRVYEGVLYSVCLQGIAELSFPEFGLARVE